MLNKKTIWLCGMVLSLLFIIPGLFYVIDSMISGLITSTPDFLGSLIGYGIVFILGVSICRYCYENLKSSSVKKEKQ